jgi:hypothetical protein
MTKEEALGLLGQSPVGRLATCGADGQPYITPLNFFLHEGKIYFHCRLSGRKLTNIAANPRVCFEVSTVEKIVAAADKPCGCATRYASVLVFGTARVVEGGSGKRMLLELLMSRYAGSEGFTGVTEAGAESCAVVEIAIEEISGKRNVDPR